MRFRVSALAIAACVIALPLCAQTKHDSVPQFLTPSSSSLAQTIQTTPEQLRRTEPPSASMSAEELEQRGDELRTAKFYADAMDYYNAAIAKHETAELRDKLGICQLQMMRMREAKKEFERAVKLQKDYAVAYNNLAVVYYIERNNGKAIKYYRRAIKLNPDAASFHSNLGSALFAKKDYEHASQEYARAMQIDPLIFERRGRGGISAALTPEDRAEFSYTLAKLYLKVGDVQHCLQYLRKAQEDGIQVASRINSDPVFEKYRKDARFIAVIEHAPIPLTDPQ